MPSLKGTRDTTWASVHMDAVRGLAALVVVLGHTRDLFFDSVTAPAHLITASASRMAQRISIGNEAVMIFFVLSGYLVGGTVLRAVENHRWSWQDYLIRRLSRLWVVLIPALFVGMVVDVAGQHWLGNAGSIYTGPEGQGLVHELATRLNLHTFFGNAIFLQGIVFPVAGTNESLWSLANEFWYYLIFPLLMPLLLKTGDRRIRALSGGLAVVILLFVGRSIDLLFPIWLLGVAVNLLPRRCPARLARRITGILACCFPLVAISVRRSALPVYAAEWVIALFFAVWLYLLLHNERSARPNWYKRSAEFLARISYSLYLSHLPFAVLACALLDTPWHHWRKTGSHLLLYLALNATLVLIAYVFFFLFESRTDDLRRLLERLSRPGTRRPAVVTS